MFYFTVDFFFFFWKEKITWFTVDLIVGYRLGSNETDYLLFKISLLDFSRVLSLVLMGLVNQIRLDPTRDYIQIKNLFIYFCFVFPIYFCSFDPLTA